VTTVRYGATGFALGVAWGVIARVWMRLIATEPAFSWAGTLLLVGMSAVVGLALGLVHAARRRGSSRWWRVLYGVVPVLFAGAGLPLLPAVVLGGWGLRRRALGRAVAVLAILSAPVILVAITWDEVSGSLMPYPDNLFRVILGGGGLVLGATAAWASSTALGPWRRTPASTTRRVSTAPVTAVAGRPGAGRIPIG
jgi:hypothetical protein